MRHVSANMLQEMSHSRLSTLAQLAASPPGRWSGPTPEQWIYASYSTTKAGIGAALGGVVMPMFAAGADVAHTRHLSVAGSRGEAQPRVILLGPKLGQLHPHAVTEGAGCWFQDCCCMNLPPLFCFCGLV